MGSNACQTCGMALRDQGEFHPHLFCLLVKAGVRDPWTHFRSTVELLGPLDSLPTKTPLVRDLPRRRSS